MLLTFYFRKLILLRQYWKLCVFLSQFPKLQYCYSFHCRLPKCHNFSGKPCSVGWKQISITMHWFNMLFEHKRAFKNVVLILDMLLAVGDFGIKSWFLSCCFNQRMMTYLAASFITLDLWGNLLTCLFLWSERSQFYM